MPYRTNHESGPFAVSVRVVPDLVYIGPCPVGLLNFERFSPVKTGIGLEPRLLREKGLDTLFSLYFKVREDKERRKGEGRWKGEQEV